MASNSGRVLRHRGLWFGAGALLLLAGLVVSLLPDLSRVPVSYNDKVAHALGFSFFTVWFGGLVELRRLPWVAFGLLLYGGLIEVLQGFTPGRQPEGLDLLADAAGILLGCVLSAAGLRRWPDVLESWLPTRKS